MGSMLTEDRTMATHCAKKLRAKGHYAEVIKHNGGFTHWAVWVKTGPGGNDGYYADLPEAFKGNAVKSTDIHQV